MRATIVGVRSRRAGVGGRGEGEGASSESSELLAECDVGGDEVRVRPAYGDEGDDEDGAEREGEVEHRHGGMCCR